jgi:cytochrome c
MKLLLGVLAAATLTAAAGDGSGPKPGAGERAYQKCYACHATEPGRNELAGPSLHGILGRPVAAVEGFDYSPAMRAFAAANPSWDRALLDRFAADPEALVPGTSMAFHGMPDPAERKALLDYLEGLGD